MESLSVDWKKFENFANRALLIIAHLHKIIENNSQWFKQNFKPKGGRDFEYNLKADVLINHLPLKLKMYYAQLKGISLALEEFIKIHENIKKHIAIIESQMRDEVRFEYARGAGSINWNYVAEEIKRYLSDVKNQDVIISVMAGKFDTILKDLKDETTIITDETHLVINEQLKAKFFVYWRKLVGIFDEVHKLLQREESIGKHIRVLIDDAYSLLLKFPKDYAPSEQIEIAIRDLEKAYDMM